jgi:hypothetical protein
MLWLFLAMSGTWHTNYRTAPNIWYRPHYSTRHQKCRYNSYVQSNPDCRRSAPRARKFVRTKLGMSSRRLCLPIRRSRSTILLKFWIKTPVKNLKMLWKVRNLSLSLRIGTRWCESRLRAGLPEGVIKLCAENRKKLARNCEDACLILGDSEGQEEAFVSPDFGTSFLQAIFKDSCTATRAAWRSRRNACSSWRSGFLNCNFLVTPHFLCVFVRMNASFFSVPIECLEPPSHFNIAFVGKFISTYIADLGTTYEVNLGDDYQP